MGIYWDSNSALRGFLLSGGQYTPIDDPLAGSADSLSRRCSGVILSSCHQRSPFGQGTPSRSYGVVPRRRPVRKVCVFQYEYDL